MRIFLDETPSQHHVHGSTAALKGLPSSWPLLASRAGAVGACRTSRRRDDAGTKLEPCFATGVHDEREHTANGLDAANTSGLSPPDDETIQTLVAECGVPEEGAPSDNPKTVLNPESGIR